MNWERPASNRGEQTHGNLSHWVAPTQDMQLVRLALFCTEWFDNVAVWPRETNESAARCL
jgi:hypothetical protein